MPMATTPRRASARHRAAIDALDREILERLNARAAHAQAIGAIKGHGVAYRPEREAQVLARLQVGKPRTAVERGGRGRLPAGDVGVPRARADAARSPISVPPARSRTTRSPGISGSSSKRCRARRSTTCSAPAESGQTDHAVVPVENSSEGAIGRTLDLMCQTPLTICGEIRLRIRQNLLSTATRDRRDREGLLARAIARAMRAVARAASARRRARRRGEQRRGGAPRRCASQDRRRSPARTPRRSTA